ncbi:MAG: ATP phosphoribosyltransferase regulatory subunit [Armatimonadota bacterium]|nr:ATP phosphoribosyltransferase regulatory subunit [Armatimonadota bacterium]MDR7474921.1 ATP phosphoribosyltransferase regulatory subunit [Armatimonadota bacterium]MDR7538367.1 ATP phosphoribosyltransferase regulatory subunit [Armatimonadota bacterium]
MRLPDVIPPRWQQVPPGLPDLGPVEAARRSALCDLLRREFRLWGYQEVAPPTLEYLETFTRGAGAGTADRLFKLTDRGGELLALRPDFTLPLARLAATRLLPASGRPLRLAYVGSVFRGQEEGQGRLREFTQAGVELLGEEVLDADAEVIALAASCLRRAGAAGAVLHIGHLDFIDEALLPLPPHLREEVRDHLYRKAFVELDTLDLPPALRRLLRALPDLRGPDVLQRARPLASSPRGVRALEELGALMERLGEYGVGDLVGIDLGIIRDFGYYTGVVFEAYGAGSGYPLLGGGRYDRLLERFGTPAAATGFAVGVERVLSTIPDGVTPSAEVIVLGAGGPPARAATLHFAASLRARGLAVALAFRQGWEEAVRGAEAAAVRWVVQVGEDGARVLDRDAGREERLSLPGALRAIAGPEDVGPRGAVGRAG